MRTLPSITAEAVCFMRALDQRRDPSQRILDDPWAEAFLSPVAKGALAALKASGELGQEAERLFFPGVTAFVLARHRFIDDVLDRRLATGEIAQVIILGAGYDTRAWRFADRARGTRFFEVDHPATSRRKTRLVAKAELPASAMIPVEVDFEQESMGEKLIAAGLKQGATTFVVWEGVSMYLSRDAIKTTLSALRGLVAPGSDLAMDFWYLLDAPDLQATAHRLSPSLLHFLGEPITFGIHPDDVVGFLAALGWEVVDLADATELERRYVVDGRRVYPANYVLHARSRP